MKFKRLTDQAKKLVDKRGGTDALKGDAAELRDIAKGKGSLGDKAKAAAAALKDPGGKDEATAPEAPATPDAPASTPPPSAPGA